MNRLIRYATTLLLFAGLFAGSATAQSWDRKNTARNQFILRGSHADITAIAQRHGLELLHNLHEGAALVRGPETMTPELMAELVTPDEEVLGFESVLLATLPEASLDQSSTAILEQSSTAILEAVQTPGTHEGPLAAYFATPLWNGFVNQPAAAVIRLAESRGPTAGSYGSGIVAVIDTGIDPDHPLFAGALVGGYDFVLDQPGTPSEWSNLDQSSSAILEQSSTAILEQSSTAILEGLGDVFFLNQSSTAILEQSSTAILEEHELPAAFGHGTMVAGIIRLVAPGAMIMPLRAFDSEGTGSVYDIARAVYYAVENGANVINMSFSMEEFSPELARAINFAHRNGVICVAAAGNRGERVLTYPSAFGNAVGVASTSYQDTVSFFSNFGSDMVALAAPGEGVITAFPGGFWAAGWGTSFAAPLVAGTVALLHDTTGNGSMQSAADFYQALYALAKGAEYLPSLSAELGNGRLDAAAAVDNRLQIVN